MPSTSSRSSGRCSARPTSTAGRPPSSSRSSVRSPGRTSRVELDPGADRAALGPEATAAAFADPAQRRRVRELLVLIELCRHPVTAAQADAGRGVLRGAGRDRSGPADRPGPRGPEPGRGRGWTTCASSAATSAKPMLEPQLAERRTPASSTRRIPSWRRGCGRSADAAPDTLGRAYVEFYERNGFDLPGDRARACRRCSSPTTCATSSAATSRSASTRSRSARCSSGWPTRTRTGSSSSATSASTRPGTSTATGPSCRRKGASPVPARRRRSRTRSGGARSAPGTSRPIDHLARAARAAGRRARRRSASPTASLTPRQVGGGGTLTRRVR